MAPQNRIGCRASGRHEHRTAQSIHDDWFIVVSREHHVRVYIVNSEDCWLANAFAERLWKSVKCEQACPHARETASQGRVMIAIYMIYIDSYNRRRPYSRLDRWTPNDVYFDIMSLTLAA